MAHALVQHNIIYFTSSNSIYVQVVLKRIIQYNITFKS